jgi:hypothetical protein
VKTRLRNNSMKIESEKELMKMVKEFNGLFAEHWTQLGKKQLELFDSEVQKYSRKWMFELCNVQADRVPIVMDEAGKLLANLKNHEDTRYSDQKVFRKYLEDYPVRKADLLPEVVETFNAFAKEIADSVTMPNFILPLALRFFLIHVRSAERQLPFYYKAARQLLHDLQQPGPKYDVITVPTPTGSGKSTLMPLLIYCGIRKPDNSDIRVAVTQPRRFAAESIFKMITTTYGESICGYQMAGRAQNPNAPIVYITDGLLRTMINPFQDAAVSKFPFEVVVIDEVHERSKDIDACIALLARMQNRQRDLKLPVVKVILSSATFDSKVLRPFNKNFHELPVTFKTKFKVDEHYFDFCSRGKGCSICALFRNSGQHHVDVIKQTAKLLKGTEQLLCFVPSVDAVNRTISVLESLNVRAVPLHAQQDGKQQQLFLESERIFIATNIAETSLTFPNLRFVIDKGQVQRPRTTEQGALMETISASQSTLRQRKGRVGRTCDGDYIGLYASKAARLEHIEAKIGLDPLDDFKFGLELQLQVFLLVEVIDLALFYLLLFPGQKR